MLTCGDNFESNEASWGILTLFEPIFWNCRIKFQNKDDKGCILPLFDTIF